MMVGELEEWEERFQRDSEQTDEDETGKEEDDPVVFAAETTNDVDLALAIAAPEIRAEFRPVVPSDAEVTIWISAFDESESPPAGIDGVQLEIEITPPEEDEPEVFEEETDENGSVEFQYDLSETDHPDGEYDIQVNYENASAFGNFIAGPTLDSSIGFGSELLVGREATITYNAREATEPVEGAEVTLLVSGPDDFAEETVETTDGNGFVSVSFTPETPGTYTVSVESEEIPDGQLPFTNSEAYEYAVANLPNITDGLRVNENSFGGYLLDADGFVSNETFELELLEQSEDEPFFETVVETDESGFFAVDYDIPGSIDGGFNAIDVEAKKDDEELITTESSIPVDSPPEPDEPDIGSEPPEDSGPALNLFASFEEFTYAPGQEATLDISVEDDDFEPIEGVDVDVLLRYGFNGPIVLRTTTTTDEEGASVNVELPDNSPEGASLRAEVAVEYEGEVFTSTASTSLERYNVSTTVEPGTRGEEKTVSVSVEAVGNDSVEGLAFPVVGNYELAWQSSFDTVGLVTDEDGEASGTIDVPVDAQYLEEVHFFVRDGSSFRAFPVATPGQLSVDDPVAPGENVQLEFSFEDETDVVGGVAYLTTPFQLPDNTVTGRFDGETATVEIPDFFFGDINAFVDVIVVGEDGKLGFVSADITVEDPDPPAVAVSASGDSIGVGETATIEIDESESEDIWTLAIYGRWVDWTLGDVEDTGGFFEARDRNPLFLFDTQRGDISPSIEFQPSETYQSGQYLLYVGATDGQETVFDEVILEIE